MSEDEAKSFEECLIQIKKIIKDHTILLKPHFASFDTTKRSHITVAQFGRVLKQLNILPNDKQFDLIVRCYADNNTLHDVNYVKFCEEVDSKFKAAMGLVPDNTPESFTKPGVTTIDKEDFKDMNVLKQRFLEATINLQASPEDIEEKIKATCVMKRVRITEFFLDFDKLRKGNVTKGQFRRILSMLGFVITDPEYSALETKYETQDKWVNYASFCKNIDSVFTVKGIDKDPTLAIKQLSVDDSQKARRKRMELDEESAKKLGEALEAAQKIVLTQRCHMKPFFQAFDTTKCCYVTKSQFCRVLSQVGVKPSEEVLNIILKFYMNRGNLDEVNYVDFINDVDKPEEVYMIQEKEVSLATAQKIYKQKQESLNTKKEIVSRQPEDIEDVLGLIRNKVKQERMRLGEFLRDFDKLRSGTITVSQFRIGLNMAKLNLSNAEFDYLCAHFASEVKGKIMWRDFVDQIEEVFTQKGLEHKPTYQLEAANTETKYGKVNPTGDDTSLCDTIKAKFAEFLVRENLDIKSFFQEWDKHRHFKVSPKQFRQVLANCKFNLTNEEFNAVIAQYKDHQSGDVRIVIIIILI